MSSARSTFGPYSEGSQTDVYAIAFSGLEGRVGRTITQEELDKFRAASILCSHDTALQELRVASAGHRNAHPTYLKFISNVERLVQPLERFKSALDTFAQVAVPVCLVWGSIKVILTVTKDLKEVPALINDAFEELIDSLPVYETYRSALTKTADCPLLLPLVRVYEEYLHFCILAAREAERSACEIVLRTTISTKERNDLERCVKVIRFQSQNVACIATSLTYAGVKGLQNTMEKLVQSSKIRQSARLSAALAAQYVYVPGLLSANFVGRDEELQWIRDTLFSSTSSHSRRRVGLYGMTGIGKTQVMLKYEEVYRSHYTSRLFLTAGSSIKVINSVEQLLDILDLSEREDLSISKKIASLNGWLTSHEDWLLMIDNVGEDEHQILLDLLPLTPRGHVILTSQRRGALEKVTGRLKLCLEIGDPSVADAVEMFLESCEIQRANGNEELARQIVQAVGYLPHAVEQSASYIKENGIDLAEYLLRCQNAPDQVTTLLVYFVYKAYTRQIFSWEGYSTQRFAVGKHFVIVFQHLKDEHNDAALLLRMLSLFEPEAIPMFDHWNRNEPIPQDENSEKCVTTRTGILSRLPKLACCLSGRLSAPTASFIPLAERHEMITDTLEVVKNTQRLYSAIAKLVDFSLVRRVGQSKVLWIHDLTRFTLSKTIPEETATTLLQTALNVTCNTFPKQDNTLKERQLVDTYLSQAIKLIEMARTSQVSQWVYLPLMALCAQCMRNRGMYSRAIQWFNIVIPRYRERFGEIHERTAAMIHNIANTNRESGDMESAELNYRTAWAIKRQIYQESSSEVLKTLNKLAGCIERQGRLKEAEAIFKRICEGFRQSYGPSHPSALVAAHNLALCYNNQGRVVEAEALYREVLRYSEDTLGPEDFGTLKTIGNLAVTVDQSGRLADAEPLYERALAAYTEFNGYDDMLTLRVRVNLSGLYRQQGKFDIAEGMMRDALSVYLAIFGKTHFHTAVALYDLGEILQQKGALDEAQQLYTLALDGMGTYSDHPLAFRVLDALGIMFRESGNFAQSDHYSKLSFERNTAILGQDNSYTLVAGNNRAEYLQSDGQLEKASELYRECLSGFESLLPPEHPHALMVKNNLGRLSWLSKSQEGLNYFLEAHMSFKNLLGSAHMCTLVLTVNIGRTFLLYGDYDRAGTYLSNARQDFIESLGILHPYVGVADFYSGMTRAAQGGIDHTNTARQHFQHASECFLKSFGPQHPNYLLSVCMLILVLRQLNESDDADAYKSTLETQVHLGKAGKFIKLSDPDLSYLELANMDPASYDWKTLVLLPFGDTVRLQWGRKNVWRELGATMLDT